MVLDYERFQIRSKKRKSRRIIFVLLFFIGLLAGSYFFVSNVILKKPLIDVLFSAEPIEDLDSVWNSFVAAAKSQSEDSQTAEETAGILDEILSRTEIILKENPLDFRALVFHGYAAFYRSFHESTFSAQLVFFNRAILSIRRALLIAPQEMKAQLYYVLGKSYYFKREYYYDLAAKHLETALNLGYKEADTYEFLVLINEAWGNTETSIRFLELAYGEKKDELYLLHLAREYKKANRIDDAKKILSGLLETVKEPAMARECKFLLGEISFEQGDMTAAESLYRSILEADTNSAEAHFRLALILEKKGDYAAYRYELRRTLENDPGHSGARSRL